MKTVLFFLNILGTAAAIPTNARFLSDHPQPTADSLSSVEQAETLVTPDDTTVPILRVDDAENDTETAVYVEDHPHHEAENSSIIKSKEENQSADQNQSYSPELGLQDEEESKSDLSENLEYIPTEGTLDLKEDTSEPQEKTLPENIDLLAHDVSSIVDSNQQENITEENQGQPINDSQSQLNRSSIYGHDLSDQGNQELAPLRASLVPMEHCITRFFEECDPNKDKHITLKEWGHCFGIKEEDIDENLLF
ncbi:SPARC like 1 [Rhinolophus ferrumequinum]|uniref:SPARC like 1 n=1 Tax=Rhinolophus ferrumequinum TaxID=59479 RepID=A0A7J7ZE22_RHIFE|nr:SPARC like 1 [Rhinolophus ferrumequinum]